MNTDLESLKSLQEVDREIQRLSDEIAALPKRVAVIEGKLAESKAQVEKHKAALKAAEIAKRNHEHEIQGEQQKISKYRDQSLEVKTNEQYKALMHEIGFAEQSIRSSEDKILQSMVDAEGHERDLKAAEAELKAETADIEKEKAEARKTTEADEKELAVWKSKRDELRKSISPDTLAHYDKVAAVRKTGIAEARDQKCSACHVMVRPQKYDELRSNQAIVICDSCSRILYYDPTHEPAPPPAKAKRKKKAEAAGEPAEATEPSTVTTVQ
jgi:predicted  nucleic acid-binding Zn-ribbon protein